MADKLKTKRVAETTCTLKGSRWTWAYGQTTYAWDGWTVSECLFGSDQWRDVTATKYLTAAVWFTYGKHVSEEAVRKMAKGVQGELFDLPLPPDPDDNV